MSTSDRASRRVPDFISIGAQKAATTWLYQCLDEHPGIFMGPKNRVRFFQHPDYDEDRWEWYLDHFAAAEPHQLIGDARVEYLYHEEAPALIQRHLPQCRLLVNLRDPVERALSAVRWMQRRSLLPLDAPEAGLGAGLDGLEREPANPEEALFRQVLDMGCYAEQLERYFAVIDPGRFLILLTDDVKRRPDETIRSVYSFLGVDTDFAPVSLLDSPLKALGSPLLIRAERATEKIPGAFRVLQRLNRFLDKSGRAKPPPELDAETRERLERFYRPHNGRLLTILRRFRDTNVGGSASLRLEECEWLTAAA